MLFDKIYIYINKFKIKKLQILLLSQHLTFLYI